MTEDYGVHSKKFTKWCNHRKVKLGGLNNEEREEVNEKFNTYLSMQELLDNYNINRLSFCVYIKSHFNEILYNIDMEQFFMMVNRYQIMYRSKSTHKNKIIEIFRMYANGEELNDSEKEYVELIKGGLICL